MRSALARGRLCTLRTPLVRTLSNVPSRQRRPSQPRQEEERKENEEYEEYEEYYYEEEEDLTPSAARKRARQMRPVFTASLPDSLRHGEAHSLRQVVLPTALEEVLEEITVPRIREAQKAHASLEKQRGRSVQPTPTVSPSRSRSRTFCAGQLQAAL